MKELSAINIIIALLGLLLHVLLSVRAALNKRQQEFSFGRWLHENIISFLIAVICTGLSLIFAEDIVKLLGFPAKGEIPFYRVHAFVSGYMGRDIIFRLLKVFRAGNYQQNRR